MKVIEFDTSKKGLKTVLTEWQEHALRVVWSSQEPVNSYKVWTSVNRMLVNETISRASIINFLEDMREMDVLSGEDRTGKGGHHFVYSAAMDEAEFKQYIAHTLLNKLMRDFPEETKAALSEIP